MPLSEISNFDMPVPRSVRAYLTKYGVKSWKLALAEKRKWNAVIVIPAINEFENIKTLLASLAQNDRKYFSETLVIFVINNIPGVTDEIKSNNATAVKFIKDIIEGRNNQQAGRLDGLSIGLVDASSEGKELPEKDGGVGLARKTGMDLALNILDYDSPRKKILVCLDADCTVSPNYITEVIENFNSRNISAAGIYFEHPLATAPHAEAIICYEIFLRYYVLGLRYAESPYSFHTIGSSMACDYESYIKIGGMNKRKAAEDFYFLEKLSKSVKVESVTSAIVYPSGRPSWRVPFGTGRSVTRYLSNEKNEYLLYSPASFDILKEWLCAFHNQNIYDAHRYLEVAKEISPELDKFLIEQNFVNEWSNILKNSKNAAQINKQKSLWFDGFRTLKFIHHLRDSSRPLEDMFPVLDRIFERLGIVPPARTELIPPVAVQTEYLQILRNLDKQNKLNMP
jgi:glycosyltransferase involved in cell wall biosynthesis